MAPDEVVVSSINSRPIKLNPGAHLKNCIPSIKTCYINVFILYILMGFHICNILCVFIKLPYHDTIATAAKCL